MRSFVEMHGGTVEARSGGPGLGSEFVVTLPLADDNHSRDEKEALAAPSSTKKLTVLIVDDNDTAASAIGRLLDIQGHTTHYAYDGEEALERIFSKKPDVVLLDLDLPDMTGYEVARRAKRRKYSGRLIALTGLSTADARLEGASAGFDEYLLKPVGVEELKQALHKKVAKPS